MIIFISGIGGAGLAPLAQIAQQAGFRIFGSDKRDSDYIKYLKKHGISEIYIGQTAEKIAKIHAKNPIDWFVYSSAVTLENPDSPELKFVHENNIRISKRDELLNFILSEKKLKMFAVAGTHGKTTTVALTIFLLKQLNLPISYLLPAKTTFAEMGGYNPKSQFLVYEADEFDRNFLAFHPAISLISGVAYDHQEIFPTRADYNLAFREFIGQSEKTYIWENDAKYLNVADSVDSDSAADFSRENLRIIKQNDKNVEKIALLGEFNRRDALLVVKSVHDLTDENEEKLLKIISRFPGLSRRMEKISENLFSDYAHTPEKIIGAMSAAREMATENSQNLAVIYEPLTNRRQYHNLDNYKNVFRGATKLFWVPSYLAREDPNLRILSPAELISHLDESTQEIAEPAEMDENLENKIREHLAGGDLVVAMTGGGGESLDSWLREKFADKFAK